MMDESVLIGLVVGIGVVVFWGVWTLAKHDARITRLERKK